MRRLLLAFMTGALILVAAGSAHAVTLQTTDATRPWQAWADASQAPTWAGTLPLTVSSDFITCGAFSNAEGCTSTTPNVDQTTGQIMPDGSPLASVSTEVFNGPDAWQARQTLYHELGQVFWSEYLTDADMAQFMSIVGLKPDPSQWGNWLYGHVTVQGHSYTFPPFEWFAEGYRYCAEYGINQPAGVDDFEGVFYPGDRPAFAAQQRQVCQLIDAIGLRHGIAIPAQRTLAQNDVMFHPVALTGRVIKVRLITIRRDRALVARSAHTACCRGRATVLPATS